jgi:CheY-like chemotaxis protein
MVLIIEDDKYIRDSLQELLTDEGFDVRTAANGEEALTLLATGILPNVILLDLMMPVMDGFQFRERQLSSPRLAQIPVCVMSAYGDSAKNSEKLNVQGYLKKPLNVQDVLDLVTAAVRAH